MSKFEHWGDERLSKWLRICRYSIYSREVIQLGQHTAWYEAYKEAKEEKERRKDAKV